MKTTKLINGKTFDEIFEQRGKEVNAEKTKEGEMYLLDQTECHEWFKLSLFKEKCPDSGSIDVRSFDLYDDGDIGTGDGFLMTNVSRFYLATPDQIELLKMYINHEN